MKQTNKNKLSIFVLIVLTLFLFIPFSFAQPPFAGQTQTFFDGLYIEYPPFNYYKQGDITFFYHVYENHGIPTIEPTCRFHLYNQTHHIFQDNDVSIAQNGLEYGVTVDESYFKLGEIYTVVFDCFNHSKGGFVSKAIKITEDGTGNRENQTGGSALILILGVIFLGMIITAFIFKSQILKVMTAVLACGIVPVITTAVEKLINISYPYSASRVALENTISNLTTYSIWFFGLVFIFAIVYAVIYMLQGLVGNKVVKTPYDEEMGDLKKW